MINVIRILLVIACFTSIASCNPEGCTPADHEISAKFDMGVTSAPGGVNAGDEFNFEVCLISYKEPLRKVDMMLSLPREVELLKGDLHWKGDMSSDSKQCRYVRLHSETDWRKWSSPINLHVNFLYEGEKIVGDQSWSYEAHEAKRFNAIWKKKGEEIRNY